MVRTGLIGWEGAMGDGIENEGKKKMRGHTLSLLWRPWWLGCCSSSSEQGALGVCRGM